MRGRVERRTWQPSPDLYAPARYRRSCAYEVFIPDPLLPVTVELPGELAGAVSDAEAAIQALNADARPALQPLARLLLRTEAIASSRVEGMQMDVRGLARAEAHHDLGRSVGSEATEILANVDAMQLAVEEAVAGRLSLARIAAIHGVLLKSAPRSVGAGVVRHEQNWIGGNDYNPCGADFVPPPPEELERLLTDLCDFCDDDSLPPLVQAAMAHAQFETIHPFNDGNGRTGRALVQILLRRRGLAPAYVPPISVALAAEKDAYVRGLERFRGGELSAWIEQFAVAAARAAQLARRYLGDVQTLQKRWRDAVLALQPSLRADATAWMLIDALPAHPIISVPVGVGATGRSKPSVNLAIEQLAAAGVLSRLSQSARNRLWEAPELLDLIAGLDDA
jgi:Fic family protein